MILKKIIFLILFCLLMTAGNVTAQETYDKKKVLIIGTKEAPPFSMKDEGRKWTGLSIELWHKIATRLGIKYEFREVSLQEMLKGVSDKTLDGAVAALTITSEREKKFDFTHPFYTSGLGIAVASKEKKPWISVIRGFFSMAFLRAVSTLFLILFAVGLLAWFFERKKNPAQFGGSPAKGIGSGLWWSAVTMTTVGYGDKAPVSAGGRFLAIVWMFAGIILISGFTAAITSSLTVTSLESHIKGPSDLPKVTVGTIKGTTSEHYLKKNHIYFYPYDSVSEGLKAVNEGRIDTFVYDAPILRYLIQKDYAGDIKVLTRKIARQDYGIALIQNSPLREAVNLVLLSEIKEKWWEDMIEQYLGD